MMMLGCLLFCRPLDFLITGKTMKCADDHRRYEQIRLMATFHGHGGRTLKEHSN